MRSWIRHPLAAIVAALLLAIPWVATRATGSVDVLSTFQVVAVSGLSVIGASFLLAWAAETAEADVPRSFAIAVLAVLAVAPEYAVDALYAWNAGSLAGTPAGDRAASLAVANMTGANRILIGLGWSGIAAFTIYKALQRPDVSVEQREGFLADRVILDPNLSLEIVFLFVATIFAFLVPFRGGLGLVDMLFLVGLYVLYIYFTLKTPHIEEEQIGVPAYLQSFRKNLRIPIYIGLFVISGILLVTAVEPFAHGLEDLGAQIGIPPFLMIQWIAPLASETPELIVVAYLVNKARSTAAFNALISSKLNQWTLLIGTLVLVYSLALGAYGTLPLEQKQAGEIWLTAGQSFFALAILVNFTISLREAVALLVLFSVQLYPSFHHYEALLGFTAIYLVLGIGLFAVRLDDLRHLLGLVYQRINGNQPRPENA